VLKAGSGWRSRSVWGTLPSLAPLTTYHFRVTATACNGCRKGTFRSDDATFTTGGYLNAVYSDPAPDPFVLDAGGTHNDYWSFTTGDRVPILRSSDLVHWTTAGTAMTARPAWVVQSGDWHPWAPHVVNVSGPCPGTSSPSCYVMYYVGVSARFSVNCVGVATATTPGGPYADRGPLSNGSLDRAGRPVGCGDDQGYGMIDPSVFVDPADGRHYLYASEDSKCPPATVFCTPGNGVLAPTISVIPLSGDFLSGTGPRTPLFTGDPGGWEATDVAAPTVEGPAALFHNGTYYLLYSGGSWRSRYGMGYATAPSPTGPFTKAAGNPILSQTATVVGPGGADIPVVGPHGGTWLVYHGRDSSNTNPRALRIDPFSWQPTGSGPDAPVTGGPTSTPQAAQP
jgi:beta-xylosidase